MISAKQEKLSAIQAAINDLDSKIKRTNKLITITRGRGLSTQAFENQLAGYLCSREYMRVQWEKMKDEAKALSETDG